MIHAEIANRFISCLSDVYDACGYIKEVGACDKCPLQNNCIEDTSVSEFANFVTRGTVKEMLDFADDVEKYADEQNYHEWLDAEREREIWNAY